MRALVAADAPTKARIQAIVILLDRPGLGQGPPAAHRRHAIVRPNQGMIGAEPASGFAYAPPGPPIHYRAAPYNDYNEPYYGASQGYAPGEKERFLDSVRRGG